MMILHEYSGHVLFVPTRRATAHPIWFHDDIVRGEVGSGVGCCVRWHSCHRRLEATEGKIATTSTAMTFIYLFNTPRHIFSFDILF